MINKQQSEKTNRAHKLNEGAKTIEAIHKFHEGMAKRKLIIEKLYAKSVSNQIYTFPRTNDLDSSSTTESEEDSHYGLAMYDLKQQNKKNKSYQTQCPGKNLNHTNYKSTSCFQSANSSMFVLGDEAIKKKKPIESNYNSRNGIKKQKNQEKTALHSGKKLLVEQYSLGRVNNNLNTKKGSQNIIISFRGTKNHQGQSLTRKRMQTEFN